MICSALLLVNPPLKIAEEVMAKDVADKPKVMAKQVQLLKERYRLDCKIHSGVMMTKGKPQPIGPTVQLKEGVGWDKLSEMTPEEIRKQKVFPAGFMRLPHVKHDVGGQVFPQKQIDQFPRLSNDSMWISTFRIVFSRSFRRRFS